MSIYTTADVYRNAALAKRQQRQLTEAAPGLVSLLRGAIHHFGEELRSRASLPNGSPEKLKIQALFSAFNLARERTKTVSERIVIEDLLHEVGTFDQSEFLVGVTSQLQAVLDTIPVESEESEEPEEPEDELPPDEGGDELPPDEEGELPEEGGDQPGGEELDFGVEEDDEEAEDISDEDFQGLVAQLS